MRGMGSFRGGNGINGETTASASRFKNQMSLLSRQASSPGQMSQISEMGSESLGGSSPDDGSLGNGNGTGRVYIPGGFPISSWDDSSLENFTGVKRVRDVNGKMISSLNPSEAQVLFCRLDNLCGYCCSLLSCVPSLLILLVFSRMEREETTVMA